ncbi:MAG: hypothetical protein Q8891_15960 [Bacteroidota bacterium]|nr:hypothetical protein [Bacteroidota bacterium]
MKQLLYYLVLGSLFFLLYSCNKKTDSSIVLSEYKKASERPNEISNHPDSIVYKKGFTSYFTYDTKNKLLKIRGSTLGINYGHFFQFTSSGKLLSYKYFISDTEHWYQINYNSKTKVYSEEGSPFEDYFIKAFNENDSVLKYTLHFISYPRDSLDAFIYVNNEFYKLSLTKSDFMPFLYETEVKVKRKNGKLYIRTNASDLKFNLPGLASSKVFMDSIPVYSNFTE